MIKLFLASSCHEEIDLMKMKTVILDTTMRGFVYGDISKIYPCSPLL
jgi:hypothetical protein